MGTAHNMGPCGLFLYGLHRPHGTNGPVWDLAHTCMGCAAPEGDITSGREVGELPRRALCAFLVKLSLHLGPGLALSLTSHMGKTMGQLMVFDTFSVHQDRHPGPYRAPWRHSGPGAIHLYGPEGPRLCQDPRIMNLH